MKVIKLNSWEDFEKRVASEREILVDLKKKDSWRYIPSTLFRGQRDDTWKLETTLERFIRERRINKKRVSWEDYYKILQRLKSQINSLSPNQYPLPDFESNAGSRVPSGYDLMVHIRHHGFPSPLLDWSESHYVAAYFAFREATTSANVGIYSFLERKGKKVRYSPKPEIVRLG